MEDIEKYLLSEQAEKDSEGIESVDEEDYLIKLLEKYFSRNADKFPQKVEVP